MKINHQHGTDLDIQGKTKVTYAISVALLDLVS